MTAGPVSPASTWKSAQVYSMAVICLVLGVALGYFFRGSRSALPAPPTVNQAGDAAAGTGGAAHQMPSLDQMKKMADTKAAPLLEKLKSDPRNADLLIQTAKIYESTHQFKQAADYYQQAVTADPKNLAAQTELASCLYYNGDVDGAIAQLQKTLTQDPKNADSLFNLGMISWQGKNDVNAALSAWQKLLKTNPDLAPQKKAQVEKLIADARQHSTGDLQNANR